MLYFCVQICASDAHVTTLDTRMKNTNAYTLSVLYQMSQKMDCDLFSVYACAASLV